MAMSDTSTVTDRDLNIGYIDGPTAADTHKPIYQLCSWSYVIAIGPGGINEFQNSHDPNGVSQLWHDQLEEIREQKGLIQDLLNHVSHADAIRPPKIPDMQEWSQDIPLSTESARSEVAVDRPGSQYGCRESLEPERSEELLQRSEFIEFPETVDPQGEVRWSSYGTFTAQLGEGGGYRKIKLRDSRGRG